MWQPRSWISNVWRNASRWVKLMESDLYASKRATCGPRKRRNVDRQDHLHVFHDSTSQLTPLVVATNRQLNYSFCKLDPKISRNGKYLIHNIKMGRCECNPVFMWIQNLSIPVPAVRGRRLDINMFYVTYLT